MPLQVAPPLPIFEMPHPVDVMIGKYLRLCMTYGLLHALPHACAMKQPLINDGTNDALVADKIGLCMLSSGVAPAFWPVFLYQDARAIERLLRGNLAATQYFHLFW